MGSHKNGTNEYRPKGRLTWKHWVLIVLNVVLALVLIVSLTGIVYFETILYRLDNSDKHKTAAALTDDEIQRLLAEDAETVPEGYTGPYYAASDVVGPSDGLDYIDSGEDVINILLIGQDHRNTSYVGQTDSMILCTVNKNSGTLTLTSFMRDNWVKIPGYYSERLNAAYVVGGFELLNETLKYNFGVSADHYIEVDFMAFEEVIDLLGGVSVSLNAAEASYLNRRGNWDFNNSSAGQWSLREGVNYLTGEQALAYCRIRMVGGDYGNDDFGRTGRQRAVLTTVLNDVKSLDIWTMLSVVEKIIPLVVTDMSDDDIIRYVKEIAPLLTSMQIQNVRIPADGMYSNVVIDGKYVLLPDYSANAEVLRKALEATS